MNEGCFISSQKYHKGGLYFKNKVHLGVGKPGGFRGQTVKGSCISRGILGFGVS